jgi:hypothetical protein
MMVATTLEPAKAADRTPTQRYAKCIDASRRVRWDIDKDVIRGRSFDFGRKFLPDGLSRLGDLPFLAAAEGRFFSQVQGRTYANMFGLIERAIGVKTLELAHAHGMGDQVAVEALVRMADEELKHQELFRRLDKLAAAGMPSGYAFKPQPDQVAETVLAKCDWAVLGITLDIELFTLAHYRESIEPEAELCELWKDVFLFHWKEESQHAILDELEWKAEDAWLAPGERDAAVDDLIALVGAVDATVKVQAEADADYFLARAGRTFSSAEAMRIHDTMLKAYRGQYITSGVQRTRFAEVLKAMVTPAQMERVAAALGPIMAHVGG